MTFSGKVCVITGAGNGIAKAVAIELGQRQASLVITDTCREAGMVTLGEVHASGAKALFILADLSIEEDITALIDLTILAYGKLDVFVVSALLDPGTEILSAAKRERQTINDAMLSGIFWCNKHAIAQMLRQGHGGAVVNLGLMKHFVPRPEFSSHSAIMNGVELMTKTNGASYARYGIRINMVCPDFIGGVEVMRTDAGDRTWTGRRFGSPSEVAKAVAFMASDDASFISGTSLIVDGGRSAI